MYIWMGDVWWKGVFVKFYKILKLSLENWMFFGLLIVV